MKRTFILASLCLSLLSMQAVQAASLWESAKNKAQSGYQGVKQRWDNLDESTKNAIIGTGIATAATAAAAGAGYAGYKAYESQDRSVYGTGPKKNELLDMTSSSNPNKTVREEYIALLAEKDLSGELTKKLKAEGLIDGASKTSPAIDHPAPPGLLKPRPEKFTPIPVPGEKTWYSLREIRNIVPEEGYQDTVLEEGDQSLNIAKQRELHDKQSI